MGGGRRAQPSLLPRRPVYSWAGHISNRALSTPATHSHKHTTYPLSQADTHPSVHHSLCSLKSWLSSLSMKSEMLPNAKLFTH